jgi:ribose transport system substrate-binding protein
MNRRKFLSITAQMGCGSLIGAGLAGCGSAARSGLATSGATDLAGKRVGISSPHKVEILNELYNDMRREADRPENGLEVVVVDADNNAVKQLSDIESFIAQKYDGIFFLALPSPGLDQLVASAVSQGIVVFNHGACPITGVTQNVILDQHLSGAEVGRFAGKWVNERHGGKAQVGIVFDAADPWLRIRAQGLKDGLAEAAPNAEIVGEAQGHSIELGASGAANLLQAHPEIKVLLSHADDPGFGCYTAASEAGRNDPDEFLVASCDGTRLVMDKVAEGGIYQATWSYLFPFSATACMRDMIRSLRGEKVPPTRVQVGRLATRTNVNEIAALILNPQAPEVQQLYADPTVMRYTDEVLQSPTV